MFFSELRTREVATPEALQAILLPVDAVSSEHWTLPAGLQWSNQLQTREDHFLAAAVGSYPLPSSDTRRIRGRAYVYSCKGPMLSPTVERSEEFGHGGALYHDPRCVDRPCRPLRDVEVWQAHGHSADEWRAHIELVLASSTFTALQADTMACQSGRASDS